MNNYEIMKNLYILILAVFIVSCIKLKESNDANLVKVNNWAFNSFNKVDNLNPILVPSFSLKFACPLSETEVFWESRNVLNPSAILKDNKVFLFYRAQDSSGTSRIGLAVSVDGLHFKKKPSPVIFPDDDFMKIYEWNYKKFLKDKDFEDCKDCYFDGIEDPRIVMNNEGTYVMTYTAYDGKTARLSVASSKDLTNWTKHGLAFKDDVYKDLWTKSGAIVIEMKDGKPIAKKIDGKYWMYFGDTNIFLANSVDLINWEVCENEESNHRISVLNPRMGYFDSRLVEPGPYALFKNQGILLIYNGSNAANFNDTNLPKFSYAAGQALFDKDVPYKLIDRTKGYFIYPDKDYEKIGEVNQVCFVEGLVKKQNKWFLYYGTADSKIAVAVSED